MKNTIDIPVLKEISQNHMHSNLSITDGVYGILSNMYVKSETHSIGRTQKEDNIPPRVNYEKLSGHKVSETSESIRARM